MINFSKELKSRGIRKSDVSADMGITEASVTSHVGTIKEPSYSKNFIKFAYVGYLLEAQMKKYGVRLEELAGIEETSLFFRFKEFLVNNAKNK